MNPTPLPYKSNKSAKLRIQSAKNKYKTNTSKIKRKLSAPASGTRRGNKNPVLDLFNPANVLSPLKPKSPDCSAQNNTIQSLESELSKSQETINTQQAKIAELTKDRNIYMNTAADCKAKELILNAHLKKQKKCGGGKRTKRMTKRRSNK